MEKDRSKLRYTPLELKILNNDFKVLVLNCKSIYHALIVINKRGFNFKISTIYKQIERGQLTLKKSDLPRCRKTKQKEVKDKSYKRDIEGHTYEDYNSYKEENPNAVETQMDTVEGIKENDAPVFFTIEIVDIKFILIFKLTSQNAKEVSNKLKLLKEILNIFYCHPYSSYEKGNIENNHELIRRVIPKGVSLKCYTQKDLDLLCSHINSLYRESLDGKCPFDLVENYISKDVLDKLNLKKIDDDKVVLIPKLLGEKNINNIKKYLDKKEIEEANITL